MASVEGSLMSERTCPICGSALEGAAYCRRCRRYNDAWFVARDKLDKEGSAP